MPGARATSTTAARYVADERMAKALSRGLNRDGGAVMPRDFRRSHGPCSNEDVADGRRAAGAARHAARRRRRWPPVAQRRPALRRPHALLADALVRRGHLVPANCPGVQMDGNRDGVPCERQWCRP